MDRSESRREGVLCGAGHDGSAVPFTVAQGNTGGPLPEGERNSALWELRAAPAGASASILFDQSLGSPTPNRNLLLSIPARCFCHNSYSHYFRWTFIKSPEWHTVHLMGRALCPELVLC